MLHQKFFSMMVCISASVSGFKPGPMAAMARDSNWADVQNRKAAQDKQCGTVEQVCHTLV